MALISVGPGPVLVDMAGAVSGSGGGFSTAAVHELLDAHIEPEADIHATAEYRRHLAHVLTSRVLDDAYAAAVAARRAEKVA